MTGFYPLLSIGLGVVIVLLALALIRDAVREASSRSGFTGGDDRRPSWRSRRRARNH
jgi:hypothetical protein